MAAEEALSWELCLFFREHIINQKGIAGIAFESNADAKMVTELLTDIEEWCGTPTGLFDILKKVLPKLTKVCERLA